MKVGIVFIGTKLYAGFFKGFYDRVNRYFLKDAEKTFFVFTDQPNHPYFNVENVSVKTIEHKDWPYITLYRFKFMNQASDDLLKMDYVIFIDADLWPIDETWCSEIFPPGHDHDFFGVQHPGFIGQQGTFEDNPNSTAYSYGKNYDTSNYWQGCFWGGRSNVIVKMIKELDYRVDEDLNKGIIAKWHDESHMNKFFLENKERTITLHPGFALPETSGYDQVWESFPPRMIHLDKDPESFPRFEGDGK